MFATQTNSSWRPEQNDCKISPALDTRPNIELLPTHALTVLRITLLLAGLVMTAAGGVASALASMRMVDEINRYRPPDLRESHYWWTANKTWRVITEYRRLAPHGPFWYRFAIAVSIAVAGVVLAGLALGILS